MKRVILCLLAFAGLAHAGTWSFVQGKRTQSCAGNTDTCTLSFSSGVAGGTGDVVAVFFASTSMAGITIKSATIGSDSFTLLSGSTCAAQVPSAIFNIDCAYIIYPTVGGTSVTLKLSGAPSSAWYMSIVEVQNTGTICLDTAGNAIQSTDSTSVVGPSLTLTGSNDVILQSLRGNVPSAISGGYTNALGTFVNGIDTAYLLNANSGAGPTWTQASSRAALDGIAFKDSGCPANAQLPLFWAQSKSSVLVPSYDVTKTLGTDYPCLSDNSNPGQCFASLQQAYCDWVAAPDQNWHVVIPAGRLVQTGTSVTCTQPVTGASEVGTTATILTTLNPGVGATVIIAGVGTGYNGTWTTLSSSSTSFTFTATQSGLTTLGAGGTASIAVRSLTLLPKIVAGTLPTKYIVFDSSTPLPEGTTVCAHQTDDTGVRQPPTGDISTWWTGTNYGCGNDRPSMWTLEGNWPSPGNTGQLIQAGQWDSATNLGPSNVIFKNVELRPLPTVSASLVMANMSIGAAFSNPTQLSQMPSNIHFINVYGHGDAKDWCAKGNPLGLASCSSSSNTGGFGTNHITVAIKLTDCQNCSVTFGYFDYIISQGFENSIIGISRSNGPIKIAHNWLSSSSIAIITGGIASFDPLYSLFDLQVTSNRITNPISWLGANYTGTQNFTLKNRLEFKACQRCVIEGNFAEWQDVSGGQDGQCFGINPRSCSASLQCDNYQVADQDITIRNNICRHALVGISDASYSGYPSNGGGTTPPIDRLTFEYNLLYDLGSAFFDSNKNVSFPFAFRTTTGPPAFICTGTNSSGQQTYTCDGSVTGLKQTQIRVGDNVVITNCSNPNWNWPPVSTSVWMTQKGTPALTGTTPNGLTVVVANPNATGATATNCVLQTQGGPYHFVARHNTFVMQTDVYPTTNNSGRDFLTGTTNTISGGLATVSVSAAPTVIANLSKINVVGANIAAYNCPVPPVTVPCLVTAATSSTVTYQTTSANSGPDTLNTGNIQQPPNNAAVYNGNSTVNIFTDTGCSGAGPNNTVNVTAWRRSSNLVYATVSSTTGWVAALVSPQTLVESAGNGTASGLFYYQGRNVAVTQASEAGTTATLLTVLNPGIGATIVVAGVGTGYNGTFTATASNASSVSYTTSSGLGTITPASGTISSNVVLFSNPGSDETGATFGTLAQMGTCPGQNFSLSDTFKNNLVAVDQGTAPSGQTWTCPGTSSPGWAGWNTSGNGPLEGCRNGIANVNCAENHLDVATSTATYTDFPGRCQANYLEFSQGQAIIPSTLTFPSTTVCSGNTAPPLSSPSSCVGMKTMMNSQPFDINNADYHNYVLDPSSPYKNGGDDGKDLGIGSLTAIDNAIHSTQYVCQSSCGNNGGPYPD